MLELRDVMAGYGGKPAVCGVSLQICPGERLGVIGPNGSGKTTLLRTLGGTIPTMQGKVLLRGRNLGALRRRDVARSVAHLVQDVPQGVAFTVNELVLLGRSPHTARVGWETRHDHTIAERAMDLAGVSHLADRPVAELSGGERQRAFFAMCLAQEPEILLLDEPTNHLDIAHQLSLLNLLAALNRETGLTVVAVFHDLNLSAEFCDRLVLLDRGSVAAEGEPAEVLTAEAIRRVYHADVTVQENPISGRPHIVFAAGERFRAPSLGTSYFSSPSNRSAAELMQ